MLTRRKMSPPSWSLYFIWRVSRRLTLEPIDVTVSQQQCSPTWPHDTAGIVYQIPCKDCPEVYTGETGRRYSVREKEHCKDVDSVEEKKCTRSRRKESVEEYHPSALTGHVAQSNHTIDWEGVKIPMSESHWKIRGIKEAMQIRKTGAPCDEPGRGLPSATRCLHKLVDCCTT